MTFMFGITSTEGSVLDHILGWGKGLCDSGSADPDTYTVEVKVTTTDGTETTTDTGQIFTCDPLFSDTMAENVWDQINDRSIAKSLVGLEDDIHSGATVWLDSTLSNHDLAKTETLSVIASVEAD